VLTCKPDIVLVLLAAARKIFDPADTATWEEYVFKTAAMPPKRNFEWADLLACAEIKRIRRTLGGPPGAFSVVLGQAGLKSPGLGLAFKGLGLSKWRAQPTEQAWAGPG
jgi:hypothetical protein